MNTPRSATPWASVDRALISALSLLLMLLTMASPEIAIAQDATNTLDPLEQMLESIIGIMTGPIATGVGIIAVAALGYVWMTGRIDTQRALVILIGMVIVFGAANIVSALRDSTEFGGGDFDLSGG